MSKKEDKTSIEEQINENEKEQEIKEEPNKQIKENDKEKEEEQKETIKPEKEKQEELKEEPNKQEEELKEDPNKQEEVVGDKEQDPKEAINNETSNKTTVEEYNRENSKKFGNKKVNNNKSKNNQSKFIRKRTKGFRKFLILVLWVLIIVFIFAIFINKKDARLDTVNDEMSIFKEVPIYELPIKEEIITPILTNKEASQENKEEMIGYVSIPSVDMKVPLYQSASGEDDDMQKVMKQTAAHDPQTKMPGEDENIVITGHREEQFGALENVEEGDLIIIVIKENTFLYEVKEKKIVEEEGQENINYVYDQPQKEQLTLFTCYPFSRFSIPNKRFVIKADRIKEYNKEIEFREEEE